MVMFILFVSNILRIKVKLDARSLLKRQKKIQISPSIHTYVRRDFQEAKIGWDITL
ncbi:hypothetical protein Goklo_014290 [Gossypium klotzschianum]|uniref:Uncharacterized protein n=1 Tax=Gossypium klotzschianum TaxID=34286 RepID=A0A7J8U750_9ROSI|nr:hypothetical protein [Gossypium klotzschianum]